MNTIYEPSSICMIRTPLLSVEFFNLFLNTEQIKYSDLQLNAQMKESILTTTFNLYRTLQKINFDGDNKKVRDAKESLLKYLIRMSTRPTPFGLLSGINIGHFVNEPTRLKVGNSIQKYVKVDGEWLYKLISYIESNDEYYQNLKVIWNNKAHIVNDRIYLNEQSAIYLNNNKDTSFSIKNSELLMFIKTTVMHNNITFSNLAEKINQEFEIHDISKVKAYIHNLVSKEIIYSTIRPPLTNNDNLNYILNKLSLHNDDYVEKIREIQKLISAYEKTAIGFGEKLYKDIVQHMKALFKCKNYLQIDTKIDMINNQLHQDIATNISEAAYLLWLLSRNNIGFTDLKVLHNRFIEKYGFEQLVNVKDLLSDITGFGTTIFQEDETEGNNIVMLKQKFLHALKNSDEIVINEKDVESLINDNEINHYHAPMSADVYAEIYLGRFYNQYNELIVISPITVSLNAGATFGRFHHLIDTETLEKLEHEKAHYYQKMMRDDNVEMISLNNIPKYPRNHNVLTNHDSYEYSLNLGSSNSDSKYEVNLDDIYVGSTFNKLYLYSCQLNKRLLFESNNMFNFLKESNLYRLLREISMESVKSIEPMNDVSIDSFSYSPRIRYKNVILKPAYWKINEMVLPLPKNEEWDQQFLKYKQQFNIPTMVNLVYGDNKLLLNLSLDNHRYLLMKEYKKHKRVRLVETFLPQSKNDYVYEIVTPVFKKTAYCGPEIEIPKYKNTDIEYDKEWFALHIYIDKSSQNTFIVDKLYPFVKRLKEDKYIDKYFLMRYIKQGDFLKLRFYRNDENYNEIYSILKDWLSFVRQTTEVSDYEFVSYEPEFFRYGGKNTINEIESFFEYDTNLAVNIIEKDFKFERPFIVAVSIMYLFEKLAVTFDERMEIVNNYVPTSYKSKEIRPFKNELVMISNPSNNFENMDKHYSNIYQVLKNGDQILNNLNEGLKQSLTTKKSRIIGSLIHMRCNRIFGIDKDQETFVLSIVKEIVKTQKHWCGDKND
ncbi:lantibiotic dehydratase [Staphylococcus argenteus]|uniref:lantibiotic dehydratase n=1 Tax=Staphylococcus argenteus TaxID=985002 RepID=UPI00091DB64D|nr:lantibiotic dehydratase [Staphylococcus argenteus]MDR7650768.1 lantibiotic dehydratase [Staphylococcus argenteus]MDR7683464.1 lantibiotic dehydratase [Staphylococcus argenteus]SGX25454.1 thiopeptide-type bacteriocin biosynthesis domain protein [Staphylococcus argenteus]SGX63866.1 thiopeptide-type bacteriocin biosynthesis domain protein [Staphylococcus argenteus]SHD35853.1 thiopeptide-type bacteriocin biosynthesis domain protein [Staphylococcus argenteus]